MSDVIANVIRDMCAIVCDPNADADDKDAVIATLTEALHPSPPLGDQEIALEILKDRVAELETAIRRLADQDATLSVQGGNVTVGMDATLTDEERKAISVAMHRCDGPEYKTLRNLLARLA